MLDIGDAFLMSVPPRFDCDHLWFVISDPKKHNGNFLIVNLTTDEARAGKECILRPGDHPWIKTLCFVSFGDAMEISPEKAMKLQQLVGSQIKLQPQLDDLVLTKIIEAGKQSRAIPKIYKAYLA